MYTHCLKFIQSHYFTVSQFTLLNCKFHQSEKNNIILFYIKHSISLNFKKKKKQSEQCGLGAPCGQGHGRGAVGAHQDTAL